MTSAPFDCLVAGDANVDVLVEGVTVLQTGAERLASDINMTLGGSSAITAFNLSKLGARVSFAGWIGTDAFGTYVKNKLETGGIDLRGLRISNDVKSGVTIWHSESGVRAGVTFPGTIAMLQSSDVTDELLTAAHHLHVGAYFLQTGLHAGAPDLFARAKRLRLTTSLDCNYDPSERWDSNLRAVLKNTDIFLPNEDEACRITNSSDAVTAAQELAELARVVVVKRGEKGATIATDSRVFHVPAQPVQLIDTTGAGDSFNAGFLAHFVRGENLEDCAQAAVLAGARNVQAVGGTAAFE